MEVERKDAEESLLVKEMIESLTQQSISLLDSVLKIDPNVETTDWEKLYEISPMIVNFLSSFQRDLCRRSKQCISSLRPSAPPCRYPRFTSYYNDILKTFMITFLIF